MKLQSLTVPAWKLPDLVEFNRRVHERIDPWWERLWIRRLAWAGLALFTLFAAVWL
jgi:penicillin-binding protein 1A